MKGAIIDLGTNTFNLLIFERKSGKNVILHTDRIPAAIGLGGINDNLIAPEAFARGVETIATYKQVCLDYGVQKIKAFGTSAMRGAMNAKTFCSTILNQTGIKIEIIQGEREAELIYTGVKNVHTFNSKTCIIDIGGGSTEFIVADQNQVYDMGSFDIGISRIQQGFDLSDPISQDDFTVLDNYLESRTKGFLKPGVCEALVGASGSFDTFYELIYGEDYSNYYASAALPFDKLMDVLNLLITSSQKEREENIHITDLRKKMIHISAYKAKWVIEKLQVKEVYISPASLKEGVMVEMVEGE